MTGIPNVLQAARQGGEPMGQLGQQIPNVLMGLNPSMLGSPALAQRASPMARAPGGLTQGGLAPQGPANPQALPATAQQQAQSGLLPASDPGRAYGPSGTAANPAGGQAMLNNILQALGQANQQAQAPSPFASPFGGR